MFDLSIGLNIMGLALSLFATIITLLTFRLDHKPRRLTYTIHRATRLFYPKTVPSDLIVSYRGEPISAPCMILFSVCNNDEKAVCDTDFAKNEPLKISFGPDVKVVHATVSQVHPPDLAPHLNYTADQIQVEPLLLNPQDSFTIQAILSGYQPPTISARIVNVRTITLHGDAFRRQFLYSARYAIAGLVAVLIGSLWFSLWDITSIASILLVTATSLQLLLILGASWVIARRIVVDAAPEQ